MTAITKTQFGVRLMKRFFSPSLVALAALTGSALAQQQSYPAVGPAIEAPKGFVPNPNQPPPIQVTKDEACTWTEEQELNRLHVLLVADTNDEKAGQNFNRNLEIMKSLLTANIPAERLSITVLTGDDVTPSKMLEYY